MTPADLRAARERLGLSTADFARVIGAGDRSVIWRWETGSRAVPESVALLLAMVEAVPGARSWLMGRLPER